MRRVDTQRYENRKLLDLARLLDCQNCGATGPCEPAHSNSAIHGKGSRRKADDCHHAALCRRCHVWLDQPIGAGKDPTGIWEPTRADRLEMHRRAMEKTFAEYWRRGYVRVA